MENKKLSVAQYQALTHSKQIHIVFDLLIWLPWFVMAAWAVTMNYWALAITGWFFFFLTGLRQAHEAFHRTMGIHPPLNNFILLILSPLMLTCLHATRYIHLRHHKYCLQQNDIEGEAARKSAIRAIIEGPLYPIKTHIAAWRSAGKHTRFWMSCEGAAIVIFYSFGIIFFTKFAIAHLIAMIIGEWVVSFFAVWMVHRNCENQSNPARTIRRKWKALLSYSMFYHYEHHAYPRVPTRNLNKLANLLDQHSAYRPPIAF